MTPVHAGVAAPPLVGRWRHWNMWLLVCLGAALVGGTWLLPYRFPPSHFVVGASYEVGFNNNVAAIAYFILVPLMGVFAARLMASRSGMLPTAIAWSTSRVSHMVAAGVIALHVLLFAGLYAYKGRFVFAEGLYFQSLLYRMAGGELPYTDFGFYYGPLLLYPASWLARIVGLDGGYASWYIANYVLGLIFLYIIVGACVRASRSRILWFAFLAFGMFNPLTGINTTFARYLFPLIVVFAAGAFLYRGGWTRGATASALLTTALLYSFDVAMLSVAATVLLGMFGALPALGRWLRRLAGMLVGSGVPEQEEAASTVPSVAVRRTAILGTVSVAAAVLLFLLIDPSGRAVRDYPLTALSYAGGAHNLPIYPHLPFIALSAITVTTLGAVLAASAGSRALALLPALAAATAVALVNERASFAAAEPLHFAYHGLPCVLVALFMADRVAQSARGVKALAVCVFAGLMLPMQYYHFSEFVPFFNRFLPGAEAAAPPQETGSSTPVGDDLEQELRRLVSVVGAARPYVMYEMEYNSLPVFRDAHLKYAMHSTMLITTRDAEGMRAAIDDVRRSGAVVVVRRQDLGGLPRPRESSTPARWLDALSGAHTQGSDLNVLLLRSKTRLMQPFLDFVRAEYTPVYERRGLIAFVPRQVNQ